MKIAIGADHAGFDYKQRLKEELTSNGHSVTDFGTDSTESCDYPDFAQAVGSALAAGNADRGILICGSGIGMAMAANKVRGVRAAAAYDLWEAEMSRRHNDANVLCLSARHCDYETVSEIIALWLATTFEGGRHLRRVNKIMQIE